MAGLKADIPRGERKGQAPPFDEQQAQRHAHRLGQHGGQRCPRHAQAAGTHQQQVPGNVHNARDGHGEQGRLGIPQPPEHGSQHVISHDERRPAGANAHIDHRLAKRLGGGLHQPVQGVHRPEHRRRQDQSHGGEQGDGAAQNLPALLGLAFPQLLAQENSRPHGEARDQSGDRVHDLAAGRHGGHIGGLAELAHHHQVHRAVHGLEQQRQ